MRGLELGGLYLDWRDRIVRAISLSRTNLQVQFMAHRLSYVLYNPKAHSDYDLR